MLPDPECEFAVHEAASQIWAAAGGTVRSIVDAFASPPSSRQVCSLTWASCSPSGLVSTIRLLQGSAASLAGQQQQQQQQPVPEPVQPQLPAAAAEAPQVSASLADSSGLQSSQDELAGSPDDGCSAGAPAHRQQQAAAQEAGTAMDPAKDNGQTGCVQQAAAGPAAEIITVADSQLEQTGDGPAACLDASTSQPGLQQRGLAAEPADKYQLPKLLISKVSKPGKPRFIRGYMLSGSRFYLNFNNKVRRSWARGPQPVRCVQSAASCMPDASVAACQLSAICGAPLKAHASSERGVWLQAVTARAGFDCELDASSAASAVWVEAGFRVRGLAEAYAAAGVQARPCFGT